MSPAGAREAAMLLGMVLCLCMAAAAFLDLMTRSQDPQDDTGQPGAAQGQDRGYGPADVAALIEEARTITRKAAEGGTHPG